MSAEFAYKLPVICNGPIIAIKIAKKSALRHVVTADMHYRRPVRTSNIPLQINSTTLKDQYQR